MSPLDSSQTSISSQKEEPKRSRATTCVLVALGILGVGGVIVGAWALWHFRPAAQKQMSNTCTYSEYVEGAALFAGATAGTVYAFCLLQNMRIYRMEQQRDSDRDGEIIFDVHKKPRGYYDDASKESSTFFNIQARVLGLDKTPSIFNLTKISLTIN